MTDLNGHLQMKWLNKFRGLFLFIFFGLIVLGNQTLMAQSSSQVNIVGIPPVLSSPQANAIEQNFKNGQYQVIFNYSSFSSQPVDFVFDFRLIRNNRTILELESLPKAFTPGSYVFTSFFEEIDFRETPEDVLDIIGSDLRKQVVQSGSIPEGNYSVEITARPFTQQTGINTMPGSAFFTVRYPPPPILVSVPDEANLLVDTPTFSWTPVVSSNGGLFEYEFLLVEVFRGQTPLQAINSNREHASATLVGQTTLPYTLQYLPLEEGATYAWQVTAKDVNGQIPLQKGGESEIYTFTFRDKGAGEEVAEKISNLQSIPLVPGFAELKEFKSTEVKEDVNSYIINGVAVLEIDFATEDLMRTEAVLTDVRIQKQSLETPILFGGSVTASSDILAPMVREIDDYVQLKNIEWEFGQGLSVAADVVTSYGSILPSNNEFMLEPIGLVGSVEATSEDDSSPITSLGNEPFELWLNSIQITMPDASIRGKGDVRVFSERTCEIPSFSLDRDYFSTFVNCELEKSVPLVPDSEKLTLSLKDLTGQVAGSWVNDELNYNTSLRSSLEFELENEQLADQTCGASGTIRLSDEHGFAADNFVSDCTIPEPKLDLGLLNMGFENFELSSLDYSESEGWDFSIQIDALLELAKESAPKFPKIEGVTISRSGIAFPEVTFTESDLFDYSLDLGMFDLSLTNFHLDTPQFPWFSLDDTDGGPWNFDFDGSIDLTNSGTQNQLPVCLRNSSVDLVNAGVQNGRIQAGLKLENSESCRWEFFEGYALIIDQIGGDLAIDYLDGDLDPSLVLNVDADLETGTPFSCDVGSVTTLNDPLSLEILDSGFSLQIENFVSDCPIEIGPYTAQITQSDLDLVYNSGGSLGGQITGLAELNLGEDQNTSGSFTYDFESGSFTELDFEMTGPFEWGIPKDNPVFVFQLNKATLTEEGLKVDGRQNLLIDDQTMGATFDQLVLNWETFQVNEGSVILDDTLSFEAGINETTNDLDYNVTLRDSSLALSPGVLLQYAGTVVIDTTGIKTSGSASGELNFGDISLDQIEVNYTDDFAMRLDPFGVSSGEAEIYWEDQRIAVINENGFNPDIGFFGDEFLPERIPLPREEIAYLQIKENDQLLIETNRLQDGSLQIQTLQGENLELVIPAMQGSQPSAPSVEVILNDLRINPSTGNYISGSVSATIPEDSPEFSLEELGIPMTLNQIVYETRSLTADNDISALFLEGDLNLMDQQMENGGQITLLIDSEGRAKGNVNLPSIDSNLPLSETNNLVSLQVDSVSGYVDVPVVPSGAPDFEFNFSGGFQINNPDGDVAAEAAISARFTNFGFSITDFDASSLTDSAQVDLGPIRFSVDQISSLSLNYTKSDGFTYFADLDFSLAVVLSDGETIEVPLKHVSLRDYDGFVIPEQNIHSGTIPALNTPAFDLGVFSIKPLAFRMPKDTLHLDTIADDILNMNPEFDLELSFPQYQQTAPQLSQVSLTLNSVGLDNGNLTGSILPYDATDDPVEFPVGSGISLFLDGFAGEFYATDENSQGADVTLSGYMGMPDWFEGTDEMCTDSRIDLSLSTEGGISGTVNDFMPCGQLQTGPLALSFGQSDLMFSFSGSGQEILLDGLATALIERESASDISASGNLEFDLMQGRIVNGSIGISDPFDWYIPEDDSLFTFTVESAQLDTTGFKFTGGGSLSVGDGSVSTTFNDLAINLRSGNISTGSVEILNEFALDISFNPTQWAVVDPASTIDYSSGVRLTMPSNLLIDQSGLQVDGESSASLRFGDESHDGLLLDFQQLAIGMQPVQVVSGQADLILQDDEGQTRLAWYDSQGFHADNIAGAVAMPDTLGLPNKDVAYIILRDQQGQNLIQSESVEGGLELYTSDPVPLVLSSLNDGQGNSPQINVSFSDVVINDAYEVISGSITADVSDTPLNMEDYGDFPISLMALHFEKLNDQPHKLYADAKLTLPEAFNELEVLVEKITMGVDGFTETTYTFGAFTESHTEDDKSSLTEQSFADGAFEMAIRGVELKFGSDQAYRFSGDIRSSFLENAEGDTTNIHFAASFQESEWGFNLDVDHLTPQELPIGQAKLTLDDIQAELVDDNFAVIMDGRFALTEITGDDLEIGLEGLRVGPAGVSIDSVNTDGLTPQTISLFGDEDNITIQSLGLQFTDSNDLMITMDGALSFLDQTFDFQDLRLGSDGTFSLGEGGIDLIDSQVQIMDQYLVLNSLSIGVQNNKATLSAAGEASLPEPFNSTSALSITVDHQGSTSFSGPDFVLEDASVGLGSIAQLNLTGVGLQINNIHEGDMIFYASADVDIDGDKIEFGQPGAVSNAGVRYKLSDQKLSWHNLSAPEFSFDAGFFNMTIASVALEDEDAETFGVSINASAGLTLDGIDGSLSLEGFTIDQTGIKSMGQLDGGQFNMAGVVNIEVGSMEWGTNEEITIKDQSYDEDTEGTPGDIDEEKKPVDEYLRFASTGEGSAVSISIEGAFSGDVEEIFYYRNSSEFYLNIEGVDMTLGDHASLFASLEYKKEPDGFMLKVAGGGDFETPQGDKYGISALGRMSTLNDQFSFGIFVSVSAEIPLFPGVIVLNELGGGFFYKATNNDFEDVLNLVDYELYNETAPWEDRSGDYEFAVVLNVGAGLVGSTGAYAVDGRAIMLLTDEFIAMNMRGEILNQGNSLNAGMYLTVAWEPALSINGGIGVDVQYGGIVTGNLEIDFFVEETPGSSDGDIDVIWAIHGEGSLQILSFIDASASFIVSPDGFYTEVSISQGFDVWVISVTSTWEGSIWWLKNSDEFGAYVEIGFNATLFKVASVGGTLKGALIVDNGYLIYASASAYVDVFMVFEGRVGLWVSAKNGRFNGGKGRNAEFESLVAEARQQAQNLGDQMSEALDALDDLQSAPEVMKVGEDVLAAAGITLLQYSGTYQSYIFNSIISKEEKLGTPDLQIQKDIRDHIVDGPGIPDEAEYDLESLRSEMESKINDLTSVAENTQSRLQDTYQLALQWEEETQTLLEDEISSPVTSSVMDNDSGSTPSFSVDSTAASNNQSKLENLKQQIDQLDEQYSAAIDSVHSYINRIDKALSRKVTLPRVTSVGIGGEVQVEGEFSIQESANNVSEKYAEASTAIDKFYGSYINYRWKLNRWANVQRAGYFNLVSGSVRDEIISSYESMIEDYLNLNVFDINISGNNPSVNYIATAGHSISSSQRSNVSNLSANQYYRILRADPGTSYSEAISKRNSFKDDMLDWGSNDKLSFLTNYFVKGVEFWYDLPTLGFEAIRDSSKSQAEQMADLYDDRIAQMESAHESFTATVDNIHKAKASLFMTLHGMVDIYAARMADIAGDSAAADIKDMKRDLEEILSPPRINSIHVDRNLDSYNNKLTMSWQATHPTGNIVENSYQMRRGGTNATVFVPNMLSVGSENEVTRYIFRKDESEDELNFTAVVRARGPSGTAISRPAAFTVDVKNNGMVFGSYSPGMFGQVPGGITGYSPTGSDDGVAITDDTPPSKPFVSMNYGKSYPVGQNSGTKSRWANESHEIKFIGISFDNESDIAAFEYALGDSKGDTTIVGWTRVQGRRVTRDLSHLTNTAGTDNIAQEITIRNLDLTTGPHYLSVRAVNGADLTSSVKEVKEPIRFDGTPPTIASFSQQDISMPSKTGRGADSHIAVTSAPNFEDPLDYTERSSEITVDWNNASDNLSGVRRYRYIVSTSPDTSTAFANPEFVDYTSNSQATISDWPVSFSDEFYVYVQAEDYAGNMSEDVMVYGPIIAEDPTPPIHPKVAASYKNGNPGFYLIRPSIDPETNIDGYEVNFKSGLFSSYLTEWTDVDFSSSNNLAMFFYNLAAYAGESINNTTATFVNLPDMDIPEGENLLMFVRSYNKQGTRSGLAMSYWFVYDTTPPQNPSVSLSKNGNDVTISASGIKDPESGVVKVEYKVIDTSIKSSYLNKIKAWSDFINVSGSPKNSLSGSRTVNISGHNYQDIKVYIRITNANGLQTTVTKVPTPVYMYNKSYTGSSVSGW